MNQYFFLITMQTPNGPASMDGTLIWEHGATRHDIFKRVRTEIISKLGLKGEYPVLNFTLERNT